MGPTVALRPFVWPCTTALSLSAVEYHGGEVGGAQALSSMRPTGRLDGTVIASSQYIFQA